MDMDYLKYLLYLMGLLFFFGLLFLVRKKQPKYKAEQGKADPITGGSISMFFDHRENVIIIAYVPDLFGRGKATGDIKFLNPPYSDEQLGKSMRLAMSSCAKGVPCSDNDLMKQLGYRSWVEFSKGKRNVSVHFRGGCGIIFNSTIRKADGAYQLSGMNNEKIISADALNSELGRYAREVLEKCRI